MDFTVLEDLVIWGKNSEIPPIYLTVLHAQAIHETGRFTSNVYQEANNAFGMRIARSRPQSIISELETDNGTFAVYADVKSSFLDRIALDDWNGVNLPSNINQIKIYVDKVLENGYVPIAERSTYREAWLRLINQSLKNQKNFLDLSSVSDAIIDNYTISNGSTSSSSGMSFAGVPQNTVFFLLALVAGFFGVKIWKKFKN